jgi:hypothetical protein
LSGAPTRPVATLSPEQVLIDLIKRHFDLVTTQLVVGPAIRPDDSFAVELVPGRSVEILFQWSPER